MNPLQKPSCRTLACPSLLRCPHLFFSVLPPFPRPLCAHASPPSPRTDISSYTATPCFHSYQESSPTCSRDPRPRFTVHAPPPCIHPRRSCTLFRSCFLQKRVLQTCSNVDLLVNDFHTVLLPNTCYTCGRFVSIVAAHLVPHIYCSLKNFQTSQYTNGNNSWFLYWLFTL